MSTALKSKGISLSVTFVASIVGLSVAIVVTMALTIGFFTTENAQMTLGTALQQRTQILLDSLAAGARSSVPTHNLTELGLLPTQISAMKDEAKFATITGPSLEKERGHATVWATNDPDIQKKIDTASFVPRVSVLNDPVEAQWPALQDEWNQAAEAAVGVLIRRIEALTAENTALIGKRNRIPAEDNQITRNDDEAASLRRQVVTELAAIAGQARSVPPFDPRHLLNSTEKSYLFYQPYFSLTVGDPNYVLGLVRVEVSTAVIEKQILSSRDTLIGMMLLIGDLAVALSLAVALVLSARTLKPIRRLAAQMDKLRSVRDMTHVGSQPIEVQTGDEWEALATGVNELTQSLSSDLRALKDQQKSYFITLDRGEWGNKLTTYSRDLPGIEVFAYYEAARTVSGDLCEFRQLDTTKNKNSPWYGLLKGDVSGKGVEALLTMSMAAADVTSFFRNWTHAKDGRQTDIAKLLNQVNDRLEPILADIGAQKFVEAIVGVLNAETGELQFAQAGELPFAQPGDCGFYLWRAATLEQPAHFEFKFLESTAPLGLDLWKFHSLRYRNQKLQLFPGDVLLYTTGGLGHSFTKFRDARWEPIAYFDPSDPLSITLPGTRKKVPVFEGGPLREIQAQEDECFGDQRLEDITKAYQHREHYTLVKQNWLHPEVEYHFDFSTCDGSAQGLVLALISIARIFRLVPDPAATEFEFIDLDLTEDAFLKAHFVEFPRYFRNGFQTYRQAVPGKDNRDKDGCFLTGAVPVPVWQKGKASAGDTVDAEGYKLVDGKRVQAWERAGWKDKGINRDREGYRLVDGERVKAWVKADVAQGDSVNPEGLKVVGGQKELSNPGYIRYPRLKEDPQFDDLTLLAIRKK